MKKSIVSIVLSVIMIISFLPTTAFAANYSSDYRYWSQGASDNSLMRSFGCWVVAQAKLIRESGVNTDSSFNPDVYMQWQIDTGYLNSGFYQTNGGNAPVAYASQRGKNLKYHGETASDIVNKIWSNINNGYYSIIKVNGGGHYVMIANALSKSNGALWCYDSWYDSATASPQSVSGRGYSIDCVYTYSGGGSTSSMVTPTVSSDKSTYTVGDTVNIWWAASPADSNLSHYWLKIRTPSGKTLFDGTKNQSNTHSFKADEVGDYWVETFATPLDSKAGENSLSANKTITVKNKDFEIQNGVLKKYNGSSKSVTIPDNVTVIGDSAFYNNQTIENVIIGNKVTKLENGAFWDCKKLKSVTLGNSVKSIGGWAFGGCQSLTSITIPSSVTEIGSRAFNESGLTSITVPDTVTSLGDCAFSRCTSLTTAIVGNGATELKDFSFYACTSLREVTLGAKITSVGAWAFTDDTSLENIVIPAKVTLISSGAFSGCKNLKSALLPYGLEVMKGKSFEACETLNQLIIPNTVNTIGTEVFAGCSNLTLYGANGSVAQAYAANNSIPFMIYKAGFTGLDTETEIYFDNGFPVINHLADGGGSIYYTDETGKIRKNYSACINGDYYYFNANGHRVYNVVITIDGVMYYYGTNGKRPVEELGKVAMAGARYYYVLANGIVAVDTVINGEYYGKDGLLVKKSEPENPDGKPDSDKKPYIKPDKKPAPDEKPNNSVQVVVIAAPKATQIKSLKKGKKSFAVKWKKVKGASGYELKYSTNKRFKKNVGIKRVSAKKLSIKIKNLKSKRLYYVKLRVYKTVNGKRIYGDYSRVKRVKTK